MVVMLIIMFQTPLIATPNRDSYVKQDCRNLLLPLAVSQEVFRRCSKISQNNRPQLQFVLSDPSAAEDLRFLRNVCHLGRAFTELVGVSGYAGAISFLDCAAGLFDL